MPIRAIPWRRPSLSAEQTNAVAGAIQDLTLGLNPGLLETYLTGRLSLYRDYLIPSERIALLDFLQANRRVVNSLQQPDLERLLEIARPDLMAVLRRDGGRAWLWAQWQELLREAH